MNIMDKFFLHEESEEMWFDFCKDVIYKPLYWICLTFLTVLAYFFDLTNRTVGLDDLSRPFFIGEGNGMLAGTRWGKTLWIRLLSNCEYAPFIDKFLSLIFLIISAVLFSRLLYTWLGNSSHKLLLCTLFSCLFVTFPLINEVWVYNDSNVVTAGNTVIAAACVLYLYNSKKNFNKRTIITAFFLSIVVSSYESVGFVYISVVISVLLMDYLFLHKKRWVANGIRYAIPLIIAVILRYVIGFSIIYILHLQYHPNGAVEIQWKITENLIPQIIHLMSDILNLYFARGLIHYPITVFLITFLLGLVWSIGNTVRRKDGTILLLFFLLELSLFLQSFIQGIVMPYRTAQTLQYFSAFSLTVFLWGVSSNNRKTSFLFFSILSSFMIYRQSVFLNRTFALNNQRSEIEASAAQNIGYKLKSMYEDKPVIFAGWFDFGENINRQLRPDYSTPGGFLYRKIAIHLGWNYNLMTLYDTNINSVLMWNTGAFDSQKMMAEYFSYFGYDIIVRDNNDVYEYKQIAIKVGVKPLGIIDIGEFIVVYLG